MIGALFLPVFCLSLLQNDFDVQMEEHIRSHVEILAADSMEGRGVGTRGLAKSAQYIRDCIDTISGETPLRGAILDSFSGPDSTMLMNIGSVLPGGGNDLPRILIAAHYDHLGMTSRDSIGVVHVLNGAHDNASGVAVLLEAIRILATKPEPLKRAVEFQFFSGEESGLLGSRHYVRTRNPTGDSLHAVVNIDAVGHLDGGPLLTMGLSGQGVLAGLIGRCADSLELKVVESPHSYESGDHAPFLEAGVPGFQLTTGAHILMNTPGDDPETMDYQGLHRITLLIHAFTESLAVLEGELEVPEIPRSVPRDAARSRVRFGIVPAFGFAGTGVQAQNVLPGSPAERAGITGGDIIRAIDTHPLETLGDLAHALRAFEPGDTATVTFVRSGVSRSAGIVFVERE